MAIDTFIADRIDRRKAKNKPPVKQPSRIIKAIKTIENFIILDHIRNGRLTLAALGVSARTFTNMLFREGKKVPKRKSALARQRAARKNKKIRKRSFKTPTRSRKTIQRSQSRSRITA